jgi:hypothetical protein
MFFTGARQHSEVQCSFRFLFNHSTEQMLHVGLVDHLIDRVHILHQHITLSWAEFILQSFDQHSAHSRIWSLGSRGSVKRRAATLQSHTPLNTSTAPLQHTHVIKDFRISTSSSESRSDLGVAFLCSEMERGAAWMMDEIHLRARLQQ